MATTKTHRNSRGHKPDLEKAIEHPKEIAHDVMEYLVEYAKENPGYVALGCVGVGFILGWKLKPW